jgi:predicted metal-binding membrane protein
MATKVLPAQSQPGGAPQVSTSPAASARRPGPTRPLAILGLAVLLALSWGLLVLYPLQLVPPDMARVAGTAAVRHTRPWRPDEALLLLPMWAAIIAAAMLPATAPLVLLFATVSRLHHLVRFPILATVLFVTGNLLIWSGFALLAALAQWVLHEAGVLDPGMALSSTTATGLLLAAAGAWQWTPLKHASLARCRSPLSFVLAGWCPGPLGALRMGASHGLDSVGCCWALVTLLFAAGVMNPPVIAAIATLFAAEKLLPGGPGLACIAGLGLVALGTYVLFP